MSAHTKEPWKVSGTGHIVAGDQVVATDVSPEHASRIVACVNACNGIKTEDLEALRGTSILAKANASCDVVEKQRDELLAALKKTLMLLEDYAPNHAMDTIYNAIAKAEKP